jgi:hypothetical protein
MDIALDAARHDFIAAEVAVRVLDDARNQQRLLHHLAHQRAIRIFGHCCLLIYWR